MAEIRNVTEHFAVAPQLEVTDLEIAKAAGFKTIICNRPDGESGPDQPTTQIMQETAEALGLVFLALPFSGMPSPEIANQQAALIDSSPTPVLAYCRSGTRSITAWALSQSGQGQADAIIEAASDAGYDLSGLRSHL
ncbi:MAG: TIGR01244 family sulfur transferase [Hyphomonadaceae bacterium]